MDDVKAQTHEEEHDLHEPPLDRHLSLLQPRQPRLLLDLLDISADLDFASGAEGELRGKCLAGDEEELEESDQRPLRRKEARYQ